MKVIIPLAGKGTRLRPHTHLTPKPMLKVAGKPVISYLLDDLKKLGGIEQIIYITGHLKEKVEEYARNEYDFPAVFVEQKVQNGTATRGGARAAVRRSAGADHLRRHDLRRGPLARARRPMRTESSG